MRNFAQSIADTVNETERRLLDARKAMEEMFTRAVAGQQTCPRVLEKTTGSITSVLSSHG